MSGRLIRSVLDLLGKKPSAIELGKIYEQLKGLQEELSDMTDKLFTYCIGTSAGSGCDAKAFFRSPEALLYYLGEIVRHGPPEISVQYCSSAPSDRRPIFVVHQDKIGERDGASVKESAAVAVEYGGFQYTIERESNPIPARER